jgi:hypothetical protein
VPEVTFPDGTLVRSSALADRTANAAWRGYGLYLDARWAPTWPAEVVDWPDLGTPVDDRDATAAIDAPSSGRVAGSTWRSAASPGADGPGPFWRAWRCSPGSGWTARSSGSDSGSRGRRDLSPAGLGGGLRRPGGRSPRGAGPTGLSRPGQ